MRFVLPLILTATLASAVSAGIAAPQLPNLWFPETGTPTVPQPDVTPAQTR
ncbi:hypothetical protein [Roseivivax sp. CAU 1753]